MKSWSRQRTSRTGRKLRSRSSCWRTEARQRNARAMRRRRTLGTSVRCTTNGVSPDARLHLFRVKNLFRVKCHGRTSRDALREADARHELLRSETPFLVHHVRTLRGQVRHTGCSGCRPTWVPNVCHGLATLATKLLDSSGRARAANIGLATTSANSFDATKPTASRCTLYATKLLDSSGRARAASVPQRR